MRIKEPHSLTQTPARLTLWLFFHHHPPQPPLHLKELVISRGQKRAPDSTTGFFFFSSETGFLCSLGCPGTHSVDQAGLELGDQLTSVSQVLGLKMGATTSWLPLSL